jgi:hypothetical protein
MPARTSPELPSRRPWLARVVAVAALLVTGACSLLPQGGPTQGGPGPSHSPSPSSSNPAGSYAVRINGQSLAWNGNLNDYEPVEPFDRNGTLILTKTSSGTPAIAIVVGQIAEAAAGSILFASNTSALAGVPGIDPNLAVAALDFAQVRGDPTAGLTATINEQTARMIPQLTMQAKTGLYAPKQLLGGRVTIRMLDGAPHGDIDVIAGAMVEPGGYRYQAKISS